MTSTGNPSDDCFRTSLPREGVQSGEGDWKSDEHRRDEHYLAEQGDFSLEATQRGEIISLRKAVTY